MTGNINNLSRYSREDSEKSKLIKEVLKEYEPLMFSKCYFKEVSLDKDSYKESRIDADVVNELDYNYSFDEVVEKDKAVLKSSLDEATLSKYCPKCGLRYPKEEIVCRDCLIHLKEFSDKIDVGDIESNPHFIFNGQNDYKSFEELLNGNNLIRINEFDFTIDDYSTILHDIKSQAFMHFNSLVKDNEIDFDELDILEKIILFIKSFVKVEFKSSGSQLGYFESDTIFIDDRQTKSLQITTLIHELSHFLIQEILIHILCKLLDSTRNSLTESLVTFILSYAHFTQLIDEYAAHNVEGRFTIFGFQDYSSFTQIEQRMDGEMTKDEIEITKSIGNTFAVSIKEILESLIDKEMREEIKEQFLIDVLDRPNYAALVLENCQILNDEGFIKAIWLILNDGCEVAASNIGRLVSIHEG